MKDAYVRNQIELDQNSVKENTAEEKMDPNIKFYNQIYVNNLILIKRIGWKRGILF